MQTVTHYGLHKDYEGTMWLQQGRAGVNALGLKKRSPFRVELDSGKRHCNHQLNLAQPVPHDNHWNYFQDIITDPLGKAMLPIPKLDAGVYYVEQTPQVLEAVMQLAQTSCPIHNVIVPIWMVKSKTALAEELGATNVQPLVLSECDPKHSALLSDLAQVATYSPRKLVILGRGVIVPPQATKLDTDLGDPDIVSIDQFKALPWCALGSTLIKQHMRGEFRFRKPRSLKD